MTNNNQLIGRHFETILGILSDVLEVSVQHQYHRGLDICGFSLLGYRDRTWLGRLIRNPFWSGGEQCFRVFAHSGP
jgi:hypothetical protein